MDDAQLARVRRHTAGWKHQAGDLIGVFTVHRDSVLLFLVDVMAFEAQTGHFGIITIVKDTVEVTLGGTSGDGTVTDTEYLLALRITAAAAQRDVFLVGSEVLPE